MPSDSQHITLTPPATVDLVPAGQDAGLFRPGDFILTHGTLWINEAIRFGQRLRIHGDDRLYTHWDHAAMIVSGRGDLVEALAGGVAMTHLDKYRDTDYVVVSVDAFDPDRRQIVRYALTQVGTRYGYLTIASLALRALTGAKLSLNLDGEHICSGLVARALERGDFIPDRSPEHMTPADLAKYFKVRP